MSRDIDPAEVRVNNEGRYVDAEGRAVSLQYTDRHGKPHFWSDSSGEESEPKVDVKDYTKKPRWAATQALTKPVLQSQTFCSQEDVTALAGSQQDEEAEGEDEDDEKSPLYSEPPVATTLTEEQQKAKDEKKSAEEAKAEEFCTANSFMSHLHTQ